MKKLTTLLLLCVLTGLPTQATSQDTSPSLPGFTERNAAFQSDIEAALLNLHSAETYRKHLYNLTRVPNVAGTPENREVIDYISEVTRTAGFRVDYYDYDVWLPEPGSVSIRLTSPVEITLPNKEKAYFQDPYSSDSRLTHGWNAYSGSGDVTAEVVYANYGRKEDFETLSRMGIDLNGKIVIARYGGNFRGFKAKFAEEAGAIGLIIYTDPADGGFIQGPVYPQGIFSNESTIQRGSLLTLDYYGDPLTPFEPALPLDGDEKVQRLHPSDVAFHTIPVAPIGYGAAEEILSRMQGDPVNLEGWSGGLPITYRLTGGETLQVNLAVDQPHGFKRITNVIGVIEGSEFPDEWVILGSHFDAWGFGATDPNSGTAMLLTLTESLGDLLRKGERPKRSILIGHWDAEEFMLIGSSEWVEQLRDELNIRAVAYINADMSVTGPNFRSASSPTLKELITQATKIVPHPDTQGTVYEHWVANSSSGEVSIGNLGGGSDHVGFYMHLGVPSAGVNISGRVPIYHSNYDNFYFYETFIDSTFNYGATLASVYGIVATRLANADLIPYDIQRYATDLRKHVTDIGILAREKEVDIDLNILYKKIDTLEAASTKAKNALDHLLQAEELQTTRLASVNQSLLQLERMFLHEEGMLFGRWLQSLYAASDPYSGYASWMLPGLRYAIEEQLEREVLESEVERIASAIDRIIRVLAEI